VLTGISMNRDFNNGVMCIFYTSHVYIEYHGS
jgi:hypothetical protein